MGYAGEQGFLLSVQAPREEALDDFLPTFEAMLASAEAAEGVGGEDRGWAGRLRSSLHLAPSCDSISPAVPAPPVRQ